MYVVPTTSHRLQRVFALTVLVLAQCTSLHPRLALLTGTVEQALDDLWHTGILTV